MMFAKQRPGAPEQPDGVIGAAGFVIIDVRGLFFPLTAGLASASTSRNIQISYDGEDWIDAPLDAVTDDGIALAIMAPVRFVRFAGVNGDEWGIT